MKITPISSYQYSINKRNTNESKPKNTIHPNFKHHPDFVALQKRYEVLASSYFRRGGFYGSACEDFIDVINSLKIILNSENMPYFKSNKLQMLIGGIAESQEPFSILASVKKLIGKKNLEDVMDLHTVDLQSPPTRGNLFKQSFYDAYEPMFVKSSFVEDDGTKYGLRRYKTHRVNDEIFEYLSDTYNNPEKAKWETRIQDAVKEYDNESFNVISVNNTLCYIGDSNTRFDAIKNIYRILKPGGIFISDGRHDAYAEVFTPETSEEIFPAIYQKR